MRHDAKQETASSELASPKIAILPGSLSREGGGVFEVAKNLSAALIERNEFQVQVFGNADASTTDDLSAWRKRPTVIPSGGLLASARRMTNELERYQPDLIHIQFLWSYGSLATNRTRRKNRTALVISAHGMLEPWAMHYHRFRKMIAARWFEARNLRSTNCLHASCEAEAHSMRQYGARVPIFVIPNGVTLPDRSTLGTDSAANKRPTREILYLGRFHEKKGILLLIDAWAKAYSCSQTFRDWQLTIAGIGTPEFTRQIKERVDSHSLGNVISVVGPMYGDQKHQVLSRVDGFILPSYSEGLPISVLEAWSYGRPVLMTPECHLPIGFERGAAVEIQTEVESLTRSLSDFANRSDSWRQNCGNRGRQLVAEKFQWTEVARQTADVYRWATGITSDPPSEIAFA